LLSEVRIASNASAASSISPILNLSSSLYKMLRHRRSIVGGKMEVSLNWYSEKTDFKAQNIQDLFFGQTWLFDSTNLFLKELKCHKA